MNKFKAIKCERGIFSEIELPKKYGSDEIKKHIECDGNFTIDRLNNFIYVWVDDDGIDTTYPNIAFPSTTLWNTLVFFKSVDGEDFDLTIEELFSVLEDTRYGVINNNVSFLCGVYGTLKRGKHNHRVMGDSEFVGTSTIKGTLYTNGSYPSYVSEGNYDIKLEVFRVTHLKDAHMIDRLEGIGSRFYKPIERELMVNGKLEKVRLYERYRVSDWDKKITWRNEDGLVSF